MTIPTSTCTFAWQRPLDASVCGMLVGFHRVAVAETTALRRGNHPCFRDSLGRPLLMFTSAVSAMASGGRGMSLYCPCGLILWG